MKWENIQELPNFTPMSEIFKNIDEPAFKLDNRNIYYIGDGFFIGFVEKKFEKKNNTRVEFGEKGEYYNQVTYINNNNEIKNYFKIESFVDAFDNNLIHDKFEIIKDINVGITFDNAKKILRKHSNSKYYNDGESRRLNQEKEFVFHFNWIILGEFQFFFFGKSKKTKLGGFEYNPPINSSI